MEREAKPRAGVLYVVGTPIGNLEDITLRALKTLAEVDLIAAEDTRRTRKLLSRCEIVGKRLESHHDHNKEARTHGLLRRLEQGESVALVTDAGTPGLSDPGYYLVKRAIEAGIAVVPIPGPSALTAALSSSGLPTDRFAFEGFLPVKSGRRQRRLEALSRETRTVVLFESPHRITKLLSELEERMAGRQVVVARELTKIHEEFLRGTVREVTERIGGSKARGEYVVLIAPDKDGDD
ncbi:MAG: 16S rRNA (cytidine(1402)-2'-O)-methyltransferase [Nitrospinota bacterium]|jgi:16S rRNA (cytidine1402-2'-O)-methyltransferase|nr:16S rRNA (cytidine(1402)-2'-O)-methyltransferase [Nitrospinota bacterium]HJM43271.1 16S rRNA (cytidine(1402)-2'-O)-methyltransferase [Nitrospinota bacterium]